MVLNNVWTSPFGGTADGIHKIKKEVSMVFWFQSATLDHDLRLFNEQKISPSRHSSRSFPPKPSQ